MTLLLSNAGNWRQQAHQLHVPYEDDVDVTCGVVSDELKYLESHQLCRSNHGSPLGLVEECRNSDDDLADGLF